MLARTEGAIGVSRESVENVGGVPLIEAHGDENGPPKLLVDAPTGSYPRGLYDLNTEAELMDMQDEDVSFVWRPVNHHLPPVARPPALFVQPRPQRRRRRRPFY